MAGAPKMQEHFFGLREIIRAPPQAPSSFLSNDLGAVSR
jgi:hypothetical protein